MKLHHVGIVVGNIERQAPRCASQFGLRPFPLSFMTPSRRPASSSGRTAAEQSAMSSSSRPTDDSPVRKTLENGGGLAHLCFEVSDIHAAVRDAESQGAIVVCAPCRSRAFDHRPIAFSSFRGMGLVEFVQEPRP